MIDLIKHGVNDELILAAHLLLATSVLIRHFAATNSSAGRSKADTEPELMRTRPNSDSRQVGYSEIRRP